MPLSEYWIEHAKRIIRADYGANVSVEAKLKDLHKFGRNTAVGVAGSTIMTLPGSETHETYIASNLINSIISDDVDDTEIVTIEGHTISGGVFTFVTQSATLNGRTAVALDTDLARVSRVFTNNATPLVVNVYVTETDTYSLGVPQTDIKVHLMVAIGHNQSEKAATTIEDGTYWVVTIYYGDLLKKTAGFASVEFEIRLQGKVFRHHCQMDAGRQQYFAPYLIIPANADARLVALADASSTDVSGGIQGLLLS